METKDIQQATKGIEAINMIEEMLRYKRLALKGLQRDRQVYLSTVNREIEVLEQDINQLKNYAEKLGLE